MCFERRLAVDVAEWNTVYDPQGNVSLTQVILWRYREHNKQWKYHVAAWRMMNQCGWPVPMGGRWLFRFDGQWVTARVVIDTHSWHDAEVEDRSRLPTELRY